MRNRLSLIGWTAICFQIICLIFQVSTKLDRFMIINLIFMCIALIAFSYAKRDAVYTEGEENGS